MPRTTISVEQSTKDRLDDAKPDGMSWDGFLNELVDGTDVVEVTLSSDSVEDVSAAVARKTADELETRLR